MSFSFLGNREHHSKWLLYYHNSTVSFLSSSYLPIFLSPCSCPPNRSLAFMFLFQRPSVVHFYMTINFQPFLLCNTFPNAIAQAISHRLHTAMVLVRDRGKSYVGCGQNNTGGIFSPNTSVSRGIIHSTSCSKSSSSHHPGPVQHSDKCFHY